MRKRFWRCCAWDWRDVWFTDHPSLQGLGVIEDEMKRELEWAISRPTTRCATEDLTLETKDCWENSLTVTEHKFLTEYRQRWPNEAFLLNQDPTSGHGHHTTGKVLFTLISSMGLVWLDRCSQHGKHSGRWLSPTECLVCMGFLRKLWMHMFLVCMSVCYSLRSRHAPPI